MHNIYYFSMSDLVSIFGSKRNAARQLDIPWSTFWGMDKRGAVLAIKNPREGVFEYVKEGERTAYVYNPVAVAMCMKQAYRAGTTAIETATHQPWAAEVRTDIKQCKTNRPAYIESSKDEIHPNIVEEYQNLLNKCKVLSKSLDEANKKASDYQQKIDDLNVKQRQLDTEILKARKERLESEEVRAEIFNLIEQPMTPAGWLTKNSCNTPSGAIGIPTLLLSDIHFGETVHPAQVFGKNRYNLAIAKERIERTIENTVDVLTNHMVAPNGYPGIIVDLAGDLISGDIHDELIATNDTPTLPAVRDLIGILITSLQRLADVFGNVMVFCVAGNHGRTTKKIQAKNYVYTNYDWLVGCMLEMFFKDDDRIQFHVSDQPDVQYNVYDHVYRLTHGNQFRGGQGFVGAYAPIARGDKKKRSAAASYDMSYDTLVLGHFHQLWMPGNVIVNGSIIGFNEYAINNNFEYDEPKQALWITHPSRGITFSMPIFCDEADAYNAAATTPIIGWEAAGV